MQVWKTDVLRRTEEIGFSGGNCDYYFEPGVAYLLFAHRSDGILSTSICSKTSRLVCASKYLAQLGRPVKTYEAFSTSILIAREQPFSLHTPCLKPPVLLSSRNLSFPKGCLLAVDATIDRQGRAAVRNVTNHSPAHCRADLQSVEAAMKGWTLRPATISGYPVSVNLDHVTMDDPMTEEEYAEWQASQKQNTRRH